MGGTGGIYMGPEIFKLPIFKQGYNVGFSRDALMTGKTKLAEIRQTYKMPHIDRIAMASDRLQVLDRQTKMQIFFDHTSVQAEDLAKTNRVEEAIKLVNDKINEPQSRYLNLLNVIVVAGERRNVSGEQRQYYLRQLATMFKLYVDRELGEKAHDSTLRMKYNIDLALKMKRSGLEEEAMVEILEKDAELSHEDVKNVIAVVDGLTDPKEIAKADKMNKEQKIRDGF
jgi:hypothetical protein